MTASGLPEWNRRFLAELKALGVPLKA